jgi:hypothetical protein
MTPIFRSHSRSITCLLQHELRPGDRWSALPNNCFFSTRTATVPPAAPAVFPHSVAYGLFVSFHWLIRSWSMIFEGSSTTKPKDLTLINLNQIYDCNWNDIHELLAMFALIITALHWIGFKIMMDEHRKDAIKILRCAAPEVLGVGELRYLVEW